MIRVALVLLVTALGGFAQGVVLGPVASPETKTEMRLWKVSAAALVGASVADIASSYGKCCESNRLLASSDRTFGGRGVAVKSATLGAQLWLQYMVARKSPKIAKVLGFINFAGAGAMTAVAVRNYGVPQPAWRR